MFNFFKNLIKLESRLDKIENELKEYKEKRSPENSIWRHDDKYLSSYCPKCKADNRSQIPTKAKKSMRFDCGECGARYRVYFEKDEIEGGKD